MLKPSYFSKKLFWQNASLAWPMACNAVLMHSMTIIDLLLIAPLGETSIAAFGIAGAVVAFILGIQMAIGNGSQLVLSRAVGAGDRRNVGIEMACGWVANLGFSIIALTVLFFTADWIVGSISDNAFVVEEATAYVYISIIMLGFASASKVPVSYFNANKKTRIPLYGFLIELPVNVGVSVVLIHGLYGAPEMGLAGAAIGTAAAVAVRCLYLSACVYKEVCDGQVMGFCEVTLGAVREHMREVIPIVCNFMVMLTTLLLFQVLFAQLPVPAYAAITLVLPWIKLGTMFANTWVQAGVIIVSQQVGKKDFKSIPAIVQQSLYTTRFISVVIMCVFFGLSIALPKFYPELSADTVMALSVIAPIYIFLPLFRTQNMCCGNMIRALGDSYLIVRINIVSQLMISIPLCAILIYLGAPLVVVFGVILFEEVIKLYAFHNTLKKRLDTFMA